MARQSCLQKRASELLDAARGFQAAAEEPASHSAAPDSLATLEEALQAMSAGWYQLAADAAQEAARRDGLSREQEPHLVATLRDVAAAFASCARACREGRSKAAPVVARRMTDKQPAEGGVRDDLAWFESRRGVPLERSA